MGAARFLGSGVQDASLAEMLALMRAFQAFYDFVVTQREDWSFVSFHLQSWMMLQISQSEAERFIMVAV